MIGQKSIQNVFKSDINDVFIYYSLIMCTHNTSNSPLVPPAQTILIEHICVA